MIGGPQFFFRISYQDSESDLLKRKNYQEKFFKTGNNRTVYLISRQTAHSQYGQLALGKFFCKTKNLKRAARFDVIANFLLSKSDLWARLAHWPRRGALCGQSKGGDSMSRFSGKIRSSYAERVHEMPHSVLLDLFISTRYLLGAPLGALGCPGTGAPVRKGELLAATFFDTKVLHFCMAV